MVSRKDILYKLITQVFLFGTVRNNNLYPTWIGVRDLELILSGWQPTHNSSHYWTHISNQWRLNSSCAMDIYLVLDVVWKKSVRACGLVMVWVGVRVESIWSSSLVLCIFRLLGKDDGTTSDLYSTGSIIIISIISNYYTTIVPLFVITVLLSCYLVISGKIWILK